RGKSRPGTALLREGEAMGAGRAIPVLVPLVLLAGLAGCGQRCFLSEQDFRDSPGLALNAVPPCQQPAPFPPPLRTPFVSSVLDPGGQDRPITLAECLALALENGRLADQAIRVFAYDPAIAATDIETSLSKFDARWQTNM